MNNPYQNEMYSGQQNAAGAYVENPYGYNGNAAYPTPNYSNQSAVNDNDHYIITAPSAAYDGDHTFQSPAASQPYLVPPPNTGYTDPTVSPHSKLTSDLPIYIRHVFIRTVLTIVSLQLGFTFGIASLFAFYEPMTHWIQRNPYLILGASVVSLIIIVAMACNPRLARHPRWGLLLLFLITACMTLLVSFAGATNGSYAFAVAAGITFAVTICLAIFAVQTKIDFTGYGAYLMVFFVILLILGILRIFIRSNFLSLLYSSLGALLFSLYIVFDIQLIVGGKHHKYEFSIDDHILASLSLYLDIINLFFMILSLVSRD